MPRVARVLSPLEVKRLVEPGRYAVGEVAGLCLAVNGPSARSWVLRTVVGGRRSEIGLGGYPTITLAQAREQARALLLAIRSGANPAADRRRQRTAVVWTFKAVAEAYIAAHRPGWKNAKHAQQWENTLSTYAYPHFGEKHVADVGKGDVLAAIEPIWTSKHETAARVRNRIELVLAYAMQREYRPEGLNPARWKGNLDMALASPRKVGKTEHFEALPIDDVHEFMLKLRAMQGMAARALEFAILTASRTGPVRAATWGEIDMQAHVWTVPGDKMKSGRQHRAPLSAKAISLLEALPRFEGVDLVFPGARGGPLSDMALTACMRRMKLSAVPHGFRSTFRDWAAERTATPAEVAEMALAHAVGDATEAAYRRGDLFEKRRELMELWAKFIDTAPPKGNVRALRGAA